MTQSAIRPTRPRQCASASNVRDGRFPTSGTSRRTRRVIGERRPRRTSSCSTPGCGFATRAPPTPTIATPRSTPPGCGKRSTRSSPANPHRRTAPSPSVARSSGADMTMRRRLVRVPASSANLGPGYDVLAAALALHLELEVSEADEFGVDPGVDDVPTGRDNLCVRAFEALHPADGLRFEIRSEIPLARGLGSSAAAIVAGLMAADHLYELGLSRDDVYARAVDIEGHPDNVGAALYGGFVVCPQADGDQRPGPVRLDPPQGVEGVVVIPDEEVATDQARAAMPIEVAVADAVA